MRYIKTIKIMVICRNQNVRDPYLKNLPLSRITSFVRFLKIETKQDVDLGPPPPLARVQSKTAK